MHNLSKYGGLRAFNNLINIQYSKIIYFKFLFTRANPLYELLTQNSIKKSPPHFQQIIKELLT